jgi:hypothetical protein
MFTLLLLFALLAFLLARAIAAVKQLWHCLPRSNADMVWY